MIYYTVLYRMSVFMSFVTGKYSSELPEY